MNITLKCPWCGSDAFDRCAPPSHCQYCAHSFYDEHNTREWHSPNPTPPRRPWIQLLLRQFDPLRSRFSPLRIYTDWRVYRYYRRTLSDISLANKWHDRYFAGLDIQPGSIVLDHGCGRGRHASLLSLLGYQVCAQDICKHNWWKNIPTAYFQCTPSPAELLPWGSQSFSCVLDFGVIHYLGDESLYKLASEVYRVLSPGGVWVLLEANDKSYAANALAKQIGRLRSLSASRTILESAGFETIDLQYEGFYSPFLPIYINTFRKLLMPVPVDLSDHASRLASLTPACHRAQWLLRLRKPLHG